MLCHILTDHTVLAGWDPELGLGALTRHLDDVLQMPHPLDVAGVVPAEVVALPLLDHEDQGVDPAGIPQ